MRNIVLALFVASLTHVVSAQTCQVIGNTIYCQPAPAPPALNTMPVDPSFLRSPQPVTAPDPLDLATKGATLAEMLNRVRAGQLNQQQAQFVLQLDACIQACRQYTNRTNEQCFDSCKTSSTSNATAGINPNMQQEKLKACNEAAGDRKGDDRLAFMKNCLSARAALTNSKIAMCNEKTKGMSKADADQARSECMNAP